MSSLLFLVPALALALLLAARRYPGERRLVELAERRHRGCDRRRAPRRARALARPSRVLAPRGTALIARALAGRPPPAPLPI